MLLTHMLEIQRKKREATRQQIVHAAAGAHTADANPRHWARRRARVAMALSKLSGDEQE